MKELHPTTQYKKDYKRIRNNPSKVEKLFKILQKLKNEEPIPLENDPHTLIGDYKGCIECHIEGEICF